ncbi:uncharacterized protein LOC113766420 [Coffea eugenioides]|uniref:uncharacterized protein LOC113766420 n=1 Tax=Coffea eugenioides TaxID=49369 RepID=UPI000F606F11|nr:uncharacterized protein LOC113766420 [Coffea eugenioides]
MAVRDFNVIDSARERSGGLLQTLPIWKSLVKLDRTVVNNLCSEAYGFSRVIRYGWHREVEDIGMVKFYNKLKSVKKVALRWVKEGYANTKFFHSVVRQRGWLENLQDIKHFAVCFYEELFSSNAAINRELPTMEEVKAVVFSMETDSAPGIDGFGAVFYQAFPKVEGTAHWKDFHPISLCNVSSKVISKVLVSRLEGLLEKVVAPWQTSFVQRRSIIVNVLVAQEFVSDLDCKLVQSNLMLKLDMEKAYNRVEWEPTGFFTSTRGVRQSDPLSPALFLLVAEFLGRGLLYIFLQDDRRFYVIVGSQVTYLAFADDMLIFSRCLENTVLLLVICCTYMSLTLGSE